MEYGMNVVGTTIKHLSVVVVFRISCEILIDSTLINNRRLAFSFVTFFCGA